MQGQVVVGRSAGTAGGDRLVTDVDETDFGPPGPGLGIRFLDAEATRAIPGLGTARMCDLTQDPGVG